MCAVFAKSPRQKCPVLWLWFISFLKAFLVAGRGLRVHLPALHRWQLTGINRHVSFHWTQKILSHQDATALPEVPGRDSPLSTYISDHKDLLVTLNLSLVCISDAWFAAHGKGQE